MAHSIANSVPTKDGRYGKFGGQFVPETLMTALQELEVAFEEAMADQAFIDELNYYLKDYVGRKHHFIMQKLSQNLGGPENYLKREDLKPYRRT